MYLKSWVKVHSTAHTYKKNIGNGILILHRCSGVIYKCAALGVQVMLATVFNTFSARFLNFILGMACFLDVCFELGGENGSWQYSIETDACVTPNRNER
jgi:hypothetical protein